MRRVEEGSSAFSVISGSVAMLLFIAIMGLPVQRALGWPTSTNYQRIRLHQADYFVLIPALLLAAPVGMAGYVLVRRLELPFLAAYLAAVLNLCGESGSAALSGSPCRLHPHIPVVSRAGFRIRRALMRANPV
jgi:hypothetical protein